MATKTAPANKPRTKSEILRELSDRTGLPRKEIVAVFDEMGNLIKKDLGNRGPGTFTIPGLVKCRVVKKPAVKARKGINPFTGEETVFAAKPARRVVKIRALKGVKEMAES